MQIQTIFINEYGRLRSGWRFAVFLLAYIFLSLFFAESVKWVLVRLPIGYSDDSLLGFFVPVFIFAVLSILVGWLCGRFLEGLPFRALGVWLTKNWLKDICLGVLFGAASILLAAGVAVVFGGLSLNFNQNRGSSAILLTLGIALFVFTVGAIAEEALFRGYLFQTLSRANLAWVAIAITSLFFASAHLNNENASYVSTLNTALAGIWFGIAYLKTRTLWFPIGLHLAWNWTQGAILGIPVSGITKLTTAPLFEVSNFGANQITGGNYGIEGGIACTIALILSMFAIWFAPFLKPTEEMLALTSQ
jgi:membrane protease YdiL (CAAX protease family)